MTDIIEINGMKYKRIESEEELEINNAPAGYDIICSDCGNEAQVPFKPVPGWKVFCRECYKKKEMGIKK